MIDHVNAYILQPFTEIFLDKTKFPKLFPVITANYVSYFGVIAAIIAARLMLFDLVWLNRLAVLAFFVRQFMDDLDGYVARYHLGIDTNKQVKYLTIMKIIFF